MLAVTPATAWAGENELSIEREDAFELKPGFGVRVGGHGFRHQDTADGGLTWLDCRMDGAGVLGTLDFTEHFFGELSVDFYGATGDVIDAGMDRVSLYSTAALGFRMAPDAFFSPYFQIGGGAEWTRITMLESGAETEAWYPNAFFGVGGEISLTENLHLGANVRIFAMPHPVHQHGPDGNILDNAIGHGEAIDLGGSDHENHGATVKMDAAGQGQFFVRYSL